MINVNTRIGMVALIKHICNISIRMAVAHIDRWFIDHGDDGYLIKHNDEMRLLHLVEWSMEYESAAVDEEVDRMITGVVVGTNMDLYEDSLCPSCDAEVEDYPYIYAHRNLVTGRMVYELDNSY